MLGTHNQENVALRGATNDSRWPLLVHPVSVRTGGGAPSARRSKYGVLLYVFRMKTPRRVLETPPLELAEFLHAAMNRDSKK